MHNIENLKIRKIEKDDFQTIFDMMRTFYDSPAVLYEVGSDILMKDIEACVDSGNPFIEGYIFDIDGISAGFSMVSKSFSTEAGGLTLWIEDLYIKPEYRGKSIGTKFFNFLESNVSENTVRFRLEVEEDNIKAINVYKKCGYKESTYIQMLKEINPLKQK